MSAPARSGAQRHLHRHPASCGDWLRAAGLTAVAGYGEDGQPLTAGSRRMMAVGRV
ncbi:MAG TPA: hypothetical protein VGF54_14330 [Streptosporangiaceae bacterium]